jgi:hypothetical protein
MSFDKLNKHIDQLVQKQAAAVAAEDAEEVAWSEFNTKLPELKTSVLYPSLAKAHAALNRARLKAELTKGGKITDWLGQKYVRVSGTSDSLYDLSFFLPRPDDSQVPYFDGRVSVIVIVPPSAPQIEVHGTDTRIGTTKPGYVKLFTLTLSDISTARFEEELEKVLVQYTTPGH